MDAQFGIAVAASADCGEKEQKKTARVDRYRLVIRRIWRLIFGL